MKYFHDFQGWPSLKLLMDEGTLELVDLIFAKAVLKDLPHLKEEDAAWVSALFLLSRHGHLFLLSSLENLQIGSLDLTPLKFLLEKGTVFQNHVGYPLSEWIYQDGIRCYLRKNWEEKRSIEEKVIALKFHKVGLEVAHWEPSLQLNPSQNEAIQKAISHPLSILTGGPGTGKTYTAAHIVKTIFSSLDERGQKNFRVILTAPTGKAVAQLEAGIIQLAPKGISIHSGTVHALLKITPFPKEWIEQELLSGDLILVDECSMIDLSLFSQLFAAIPEGARVVFIGDKFQLPPVESGSVFADLVDSGVIETTELTHSLRSEQEELLQFSFSLRQGNVEEAWGKLSSCTSDFLKWVDLDEGRFKNQELWERYGGHFFYHFTEIPEEQTLFSWLKKFSLLSCTREGEHGVKELNRFFLSEVTKRLPQDCFWVSPIMIVKNDDEIQLFNGDLGVLIQKRKNGKEEEREAFFLGRGGGLRKVNAFSLPPFELCYCLSVHKSQGSEYDEIGVIAAKGGEVFGREVLYTAITRARSKVALFTSEETFRKTVARSSRKMTGIYS